MRLLVGLGNPGREYVGTRHNVGFTVVDRLADRAGIKVAKKKFNSLMGRGNVAGIDTLLLKPQTYMNLSGFAVRQAAAFFGLVSSDLLVFHDDLDIEAGRIKVASGGGAGGHKGISSIIENLGANTFPRIKIGIGRPDPDHSSEEYVLGRFSSREEEVVDRAIELAVQAAEVMLVQGLEEAQTYFNRKGICTKEVEV